MKKYLPVILLLATVTLSACGTQKVDTGKSINKEEGQKAESFMSLKDLLGLGTSQKCTYELNSDGEVMKGEVAVDGKKFKQTIEIINEEGATKVYTISDGVYYYLWNDQIKENGTKIKLEEMENLSSSPTGAESSVDNGEQSQQALDMNKKIDYKCNPATLSEADLALPTDVKFTDLTEMMKGWQLIPSQGE